MRALTRSAAPEAEPGNSMTFPANRDQRAPGRRDRLARDHHAFVIFAHPATISTCIEKRCWTMPPA
jgi:hypothetical protein